MATKAGEPAYAIACEDVAKRYPGQVALKGVTLAVPVGEIRALVGENGAGKSTLLGILSGRVVPTGGSVAVFGEKLRIGDPRASHRAGIATIYQELTIVPALSARANVFLGQERLQQGALLAEKAMSWRFAELCREFEVTLGGDETARTLSVAQQQMLEIMRGIQANARILMFDEPTAALSERDREVLLGHMRRLKRDGVTIVFVSHNLDEVLAVADVVTVLRDGEEIETAPRTEWTKSRLVRAMLGRESGVEFGHLRRPDAPVALRATDVSLPGAVDGISIEVKAGEIVGLAGLVGSGRTSLLRSIAGLEAKSTGRLEIDGKPVDWPTKPRRALGLGIALLPEDRKNQGLVLGRSVADNVTMVRLKSVADLGLVSPRKQRDVVERILTPLGLRSGRASARAGSLSGGNQQKVVFAKWLYASPSVLLADEPTRGVDVGAKAEILASFERAAEHGLAIIVTSSEIEEVLAISDRIIVLAAGRCVEEFDLRSQSVTVADLLHAAFEVESADTEAR